MDFLFWGCFFERWSITRVVDPVIIKKNGWIFEFIVSVGVNINFYVTIFSIKHFQREVFPIHGLNNQTNTIISI